MIAQEGNHGSGHAWIDGSGRAVVHIDWTRCRFILHGSHPKNDALALSSEQQSLKCRSLACVWVSTAEHHTMHVDMFGT